MKRAFFSLFLLLVACNTRSGIQAGEQTDGPSGAIPALMTPASLPGPGGLARSRYRLDVEYDYPARQLHVIEWIDYLNGGEDQLHEIVLIIEAERLGAEFVLRELIWGDGSAVVEYEREEGLLRIPLAEPLEAGEIQSLGLSYRLEPTEGEGLLGHGGRQSNFADWYPFVPPYGEDGWVLHPPGEVGEYLVYESADFHVSIRVSGAPEGLVIAAAAPARETETGLDYTLEGARRFVWSASEHYVGVNGQAGEIPIMAYVFEGHEAAGEAAVAVSAEALALYEELFAPYPYASLSIVEADFPDGMESDGLFWLYSGFFDGYGDGLENYLSTLSAHEVAHNWWFGRVGNDAALEPWLDEAFAIYSELLYYEHAHPELVDWWWNFRVLDYAPSGAVDSSIYDHSAFAPYVHAVYFRGALFMDALRQEMGDADFFAFLSAYQQEGAGRVVDDDFFFDLARQLGEPDVDGLVEEYFGNR